MPEQQAQWLVAFAFGLLNGFGFAAALIQTGLPLWLPQDPHLTFQFC